MERSVKLKLLHTYYRGVAQSCILHPNLVDAALCTKHMLFFQVKKLILIQDAGINSKVKTTLSNPPKCSNMATAAVFLKLLIMLVN